MFRRIFIYLILFTSGHCMFSVHPLLAREYVKDVDALGITVSDLNLSIRFYTQVLGFTQVAETEVFGEEYETLFGVFDSRMRVATMQLGEQLLDLIEFLTPRGRPIPLTSKGNDRWYQHIAIVTSDIDKAYEKIRKNDVQHTSNAPQVIPAAQKGEGNVKAFYFEDPDGHPLMLVQFMGEEKKREWYQGDNDKLFLGINNTAFVVSGTEESLRFYRDTLGFIVFGEETFSGKAFEHLTGVRGSRVRRTLLEAPDGGMPIFLLEFLQPADAGRDIPEDTQVNDLWHWQVQVEVEEIQALKDKIAERGYTIVSEELSDFEDSFIGIKNAFIARDPDGHALLFYTSKEAQGR